MKKEMQEWNRLLVFSMCIAVIIMLIFQLVLGIAVIRGNSMNPACGEGDLLFFSRLPGTPEAGDIVLIQNGQTENYVKRIIGIPGDEVYIDNRTGTVFVNGAPKEESYVIGKTYQKENVEYPVVLDQLEYFVLGDNREESLDSRNFGTVEIGQIIGKELFVFHR